MYHSIVHGVYTTSQSWKEPRLLKEVFRFNRFFVLRCEVMPENILIYPSEILYCTEDNCGVGGRGTDYAGRIASLQHKTVSNNIPPWLLELCDPTKRSLLPRYKSDLSYNRSQHVASMHTITDSSHVNVQYIQSLRNIFMHNRRNGNQLFRNLVICRNILLIRQQ